MLGHGQRHSSPDDAEFIRQCLQQAGLAASDIAIAFQMHYGGLEYWVREPHDRIRFDLLRLRGTAYVAEGYLDEAGRSYYECATHETAQFGFFLDESGTLYVEGGSLLAIASSLEKYIEADAVHFETLHVLRDWYSIDFGEVPTANHDFDRHVKSLRVPMVPEASDAYGRWWANDNTRICRRVYWDTLDHRDTVFASVSRLVQAEILVESLAGIVNGRIIPPT
jgi:hypothetical protein